MPILNKIAALAVILLMIGHAAHAQSEQGTPYTRRGSIGKERAQAPAPNEPIATLPMEQWLKQRFIFIPRTRQLPVRGSFWPPDTPPSPPPRGCRSTRG